MPENPLGEKQAQPAAAKEIPNAKERLYDKIPIKIKTLDRIIFVLIVALVAVTIIGILRGQGLL